MRRYILRDREVVPYVGPLKEWAMQTWGDPERSRRVAVDQFGEVRVSTVFLGLDHNWSGTGPPLVFETMVFGGPPDVDGEQVRTSTWAEAVEAHKAMCRRVQEAPDPPA